MRVTGAKGGKNNANRTTKTARNGKKKEDAEWKEALMEEEGAEYTTHEEKVKMQ